MSAKRYLIREGEKQDCMEIFRLVKEIADYEKLSHQVTLSAEEFARDGFGERPLYQCLVAQDTSVKDSRRLIGYCLYYYTYSTFQGKSVYLEDLYVTSNWRGQGVGTDLLKQLAKVVADNGCARLDFIVLKWNQSSIEYYRKLGAENISETEQWHLFRINKPEIERIASP